MKDVLVTGHLGFVGKHLVPYLYRCGYRVHGFDIQQRADIRDYEQIRSYVEQVNPDLIFHLAAQAFVPEGTTDPRRALEVNTIGTFNVLESVKNTGNRARVMLAGTSAEYGYATSDLITEETVPTPDTPYGVSKLAAGQLGLVYAKLHKINVVVTRAFNHTGPGHASVYAIPSFAKKIVECELGEREYVEHGDLRAMRNYTDVRDIVRAYERAIYLESGIYNLCSPNSVRMQEVLDLLISKATAEIKVKSDPGLYRLGYQTGPERLPEPSCEKFHTITGWKPEIPLEQTLVDTLDYWRKELKPPAKREYLQPNRADKRKVKK